MNGAKNEQPTLEATGIQFAYGQRSILNDINLEARFGEVIGLVGPNGSGKTTLLRIASGSLAPQKGSVYIQGRELPSLRPKDRARLVAMVHQSPAVPPGFTALEVVLMGRNPHLGFLQWEGPKDIEVCRQVMELTETWEFADRPVSALSGGELQRVFIARALAQETPVLILDEPTSHLDISFQTNVLDMIETIRRKTRITVLVAMHDLTLAAQYCSRIVALHQGAIVASGDPSDVLTVEVVSKVFGASVSIIEHPVHNTPVVLPVGRAVSLKHRVGE
jgi:iron complex transport system ATP-binding protein